MSQQQGPGGQQDPKQMYPTPPFPEQHQCPPGTEQQMHPRPDHGEQSYKGMGRLAGKAAIITGSDSGIGKAVAIAFAREGADVLISYLNEDEDAQDTRHYVEEAGRKAVLMPGDISQEQHCQQIVQRALQEFGHLNILVNNAARQILFPSIDQIPSEEWDYIFRTNIYAQFYLTKAAWPYLKPGSAIINTTSVEAYQPKPSLLAYAVTKGAIMTFTKGLAEEGIERGIRVNAVAPGPVWTPLIPSSMPPQQVSTFGQQSPEKRPAQPAELAPAYVFLAASQESSYVNGEVLGVHGGMPILT